MKITPIISILILFANCTTNKTDYEFSEKTCVIFKEDPNEKDIPFEPTISDVEEVEIAFRDYLKKSKTDTTNYKISQNNIPKPDELKYYKRRYFGRENIEGEKVIKVEYIFNRCMTPKDRNEENWKNIRFIQTVDSMCWFNFQYNMERMEIYGL